MSAIGRRYARAGFEAAFAEGAVQSVSTLIADLRSFSAALAASEDLAAVLANPAFAASRTAVVTQVVAKLSLSPIAAKLILLLCSAERVGLIEEVAAQAQALADAQVGRARAQVRTVLPLDDSQKARIARALEKRVGGRVELDVVIDPTILGGLWCQVGDMTFDNSVRRQLEMLSERLVR